MSAGPHASAAPFLLPGAGRTTQLPASLLPTDETVKLDVPLSVEQSAVPPPQSAGHPLPHSDGLFLPQIDFHGSYSEAHTAGDFGTVLCICQTFFYGFVHLPNFLLPRLGSMWDAVAALLTYVLFSLPGQQRVLTSTSERELPWAAGI